jgi:putative transposase
MPNHYHLVLRPLVDGEMSRFMGWVGGTHTMRYHAHYHTSSLWRWLRKPEPEPKLLSPWPLPRLPKWVARVNEPLTKNELTAVRLSANRGRPLGDEGWVESTARRLNLESTMRPRGRPRVRPNTPKQNKEA